MKKLIYVIIALFLSISLAKADYESLDKYSFSKEEFAKISKEKVLIKVKLAKDFPKYKNLSGQLDQLVYNKLAPMSQTERKNYLKNAYVSFYAKYTKVDSINYTPAKKNFAKLVLKYLVLENYVMYYYNK